MNLILQGHDKLHVVCPLDVKFKNAGFSLVDPCSLVLNGPPFQVYLRHKLPLK